MKKNTPTQERRDAYVDILKNILRIVKIAGDKNSRFARGLGDDLFEYYSELCSEKIA